MKKSRFRFFKTKWFYIILILILALAGYLWRQNGNKAPVFESVTAAVSDVIETVSVTGSILPVERTSLAFKRGGVVMDVFVKVGDQVRKGQPIAALEDALERAALAQAEASLNDASRNLTPEEMAVESALLTNAQKNALNAAKESLTVAEKAIFNYADTFFNNPQSPNPTISIRADTLQEQIEINNARVKVTDTLNVWTKDLANTAERNPAEVIANTREFLDTIHDFMLDLSRVINKLSPGNSNLSQSTINAYIQTINTGVTTLNGAIETATLAETGLRSAETAYDLKLAGNSQESIAALRAKVNQAKAELDALTITSPIDGIVTKAEPKVGEYVAAGQSGFMVQNDEFKVEAFVPEADIAKISLGDIASSTLDAYGAYVNFPANVFMIDPAETIIEGVPTYKVTLKFLNKDERIRSGMTANLEVMTDLRRGVIAVPYRAVMNGGGAKTVRLVSADGLTYISVPVITGLRGSNGTIEIVSGIVAGDKVVTYVK